MTGIERIAAERKRQIEVEGWTPEHDAQHMGSALAKAGLCYAFTAIMDPYENDAGVPIAWPWDSEWWKPKDPIRDLERAGALIAAEIDRRLVQK